MSQASPTAPWSPSHSSSSPPTPRRRRSLRASRASAGRTASLSMTAREITLLRQEPEGRAVARPDGAEMPPVEGDDQIRVQTFGQSDHRGIRATEREVSVSSNKLSDARPVLRGWSLDDELR